jgi:hypothetical protein
MKAPKQTHIVEFEYLNRGEMKRLLKWCNTCCFHPFTTQTGSKQGFRFLFSNRFDAQRFIFQHKLLFDDIDGFNPIDFPFGEYD